MFRRYLFTPVNFNALLVIYKHMFSSFACDYIWCFFGHFITGMQHSRQLLNSSHVNPVWQQLWQHLENALSLMFYSSFVQKTVSPTGCKGRPLALHLTKYTQNQTMDSFGSSDEWWKDASVFYQILFGSCVSPFFFLPDKSLSAEVKTEKGSLITIALMAVRCN